MVIEVIVLVLLPFLVLDRLVDGHVLGLDSGVQGLGGEVRLGVDLNELVQSLRLGVAVSADRVGRLLVDRQD